VKSLQRDERSHKTSLTDKEHVKSLQRDERSHKTSLTDKEHVKSLQRDEITNNYGMTVTWAQTTELLSTFPGGR
jgi:hypothetical protein